MLTGMLAIKVFMLLIGIGVVSAVGYYIEQVSKEIA
jgi:hypothetical protein